MVTFSTTRHGGVSRFPFASMNISYGVGDNPHSVAINRGRIKKQLGIRSLLSAKQVHGDACYIADKILLNDLEIDGYDALMTDQIGVALMIQQADCQAITLYDPTHSAIAAIHSGWQGSVLDIIGKTVRTMSEQYGTSAVNVQATISPSLGPCCAEFINHTRELPSSFLAFQAKENYFDFWQISKMQLMQVGLKEEHIEIAARCTSCSSNYFSYRRACREGDGRTGRCATIIAILP